MQGIYYSGYALVVLEIPIKVVRLILFLSVSFPFCFVKAQTRQMLDFTYALTNMWVYIYSGSVPYTMIIFIITISYIIIL